MFDMDAMLEAGKLKIAPTVPREIAEEIVSQYFRGEWGRKPDAFDFAEAGRLQPF